MKAFTHATKRKTTNRRRKNETKKVFSERIAYYFAQLHITQHDGKKQFIAPQKGRKSQRGSIPPIIFEGGCNPPIIHPNNLSYAAIFDDLSC